MVHYGLKDLVIFLHKDMLVWSDNPNNRMMKLIDGQSFRI